MAFIPRQPIRGQQMTIFILEGGLAVMFRLLGDVALQGSAMARADRECPVTGLPLELGYALPFHPRIRCGFDLPDHISAGGGPGKDHELVDMVCDRIHRQEGSIHIANDTTLVSMQCRSNASRMGCRSLVLNTRCTWMEERDWGTEVDTYRGFHRPFRADCLTWSWFPGLAPWAIISRAVGARESQTKIGARESRPSLHRPRTCTMVRVILARNRPEPTWSRHDTGASSSLG